MDTKEKSEAGSLVKQMVEGGLELEDDQVKKLVERNDYESWALLVKYIKGNTSKRLEQILLCINFDLMKPENFDTYTRNKKAVEQLLEEKDGVIDANKREQAKLLLQSIPRPSMKD